MNLDDNNYYRDSESILYNECKRCVSFHAIITLIDGTKLDGIVEDVDTNRVTMLVGEDIMEQETDSEYGQQRQQFTQGRPRRRFRRYRRRFFPFNRLAAIALLQYPYFMPPFPYFIF